MQLCRAYLLPSVMSSRSLEYLELASCLTTKTGTHQHGHTQQQLGMECVLRTYALQAGRNKRLGKVQVLQQEPWLQADMFIEETCVEVLWGRCGSSRGCCGRCNNTSKSSKPACKLLHSNVLRACPWYGFRVLDKCAV